MAGTTLFYTVPTSSESSLIQNSNRIRNILNTNTIVSAQNVEVVVVHRHSRSRSESESLQSFSDKPRVLGIRCSHDHDTHPVEAQSLQSAASAPPCLDFHIKSKETRRSAPPSPLPARRRRIFFYQKHEPYYGFTNFSPHPVDYEGKRYPTSEHLFQSQKFAHRPNLAEHIRTCHFRPSKAFSEARRFQPEVRSDWEQVNIEVMDMALWHKFTQHGELKEELLSTGDAELVENSDKDAFWGIGSDGKGRNELGKALERLRAKLRAQL